MRLPINIKVTIEAGEGQSLTRSVGKKATVVGYRGPFVEVMVDDTGRRLVLPEYIQPYPDYSGYTSVD